MRMLVCLDGSPYSEAAAALALHLLQGVPGGELTALHIVNVVAASGNLIKDLPGRLGFEPTIVSAEVGEEHDATGRELLGRFKLSAQARGMTVQTVLEHGAVLDRIVHWSGRFDLIILGLRGETEAEHEGQGGANVHNVLTSIGVPALLVPKDARQLTGITVGYDSSAAAEHTVRAIKPLVQAFGLPVHAVYVAEPGEDGAVLDEVDLALGPDAFVTHHVVHGGVVHEVLAEQAKLSGANVLAVGFQGDHPLKSWVFGSAAEYICRNTNLIVLVSR